MTVQKQKAEKKRNPRRWLWRGLIAGGVLSLLGVLAVAGAVLWALITFGPSLPDHHELSQYEPPVATRIHAGDGSLLTEFARETRLFVPIETMPKPLLHAVLSAEDKNFYNHSGVDYFGIIRAQIRNLRYIGQGRRQHGASTITQQVTRIFLLNDDYTYKRKIREAILSYRVERAYSKDRILELYLNEIYFGYRAYGVAAAALNYFNKSLDDLSLAEMAFLAALPKGPANYHPERHNGAAVGRRNWVLSRMHINGYITAEQRDVAQAEPLIAPGRDSQDRVFRADYYEEAVRRRIAAQYGDDALYEGGLSVRTSLEPRLQRIAEKSLRDGLIAYDRRHGWRGAITQRSVTGDWAERLSKVPTPLPYQNWSLALVMELRGDGAVVGFQDKSIGFIPFAGLEWARKWLPDQRYTTTPKDVTDVLSVGDVIPVSSRAGPAVALDTFFDDEGLPLTDVALFDLQQIPDIEGAILALDPHTGRVLAMVGGFDYRTSQYNRAIQAKRQPGSAFKPFVYGAALEQGFTPSSLILDAPFVIDQGQGQGKWKPRNSSGPGKYYGPSTMRLGLEKSRNLMTVRLAQYLGMDRVAELAGRFGLADRLEPTLAGSLGAGEVTLIDLTAAYGMLVNGGKRIKPSLIDRVADRYGKTVFREDQRPCEGCDASDWIGQAPPQVPDDRQTVIDPRHAYQLVNMLKGVVDRGTGRRIRSLGFPLAGKTGTTNDALDTWFVGFSPDLVVGVFVGFDQPRTLGLYEEGSSTAAPIFKDFMGAALGDQPAIPFRQPPGIVLVQVDAESGLPSPGGGRGTILEAFIPGLIPSAEDRGVLDGTGALMQTQADLQKGAGGIY